MNWNVIYIEEAKKDFEKLDGSQQKLIRKAIEKTSKNPVSRNNGGYGIPLGNKGGHDLTGLFEVKLRGAGLRAIYKLIQTATEMLIIVVGVREDEEAYKIAFKRVNKHNL